IVTMSAKKLGLVAILRPVGRPRGAARLGNSIPRLTTLTNSVSRSYADSNERIHMATVASLCTGIVNHLARLGFPTADHLMPGASEEKIRALTGALPFALPGSVVELYRWSEGVPVAAGTCNVFFPGYGMDCFQYMVETYHELSNAPDFPCFRCGDIQ